MRSNNGPHKLWTISHQFPPTHLHLQEHPAPAGTLDVPGNTNILIPILKDSTPKVLLVLHRRRQGNPRLKLLFCIQRKACQGDTCITGSPVSPQTSPSHLWVPREGGRFLHSPKKVVQVTFKTRNLGKNTPPTDCKYNPVFVCCRPMWFHRPDCGVIN